MPDILNQECTVAGEVVGRNKPGRLLTKETGRMVDKGERINRDGLAESIVVVGGYGETKGKRGRLPSRSPKKGFLFPGWGRDKEMGRRGLINAAKTITYLDVYFTK